ncbi:hypothetical protein PsYK624_124710 [Phanerochaete sordida]|uniref:DUF6532 domain-containing protein n=1 Tax=Phanerochaete sordida TaxID=48140 RepID=A0A9P3GIN8_9APHY|nr:hypothetical protein PsYK624_124710 [Phanerochaete sordida]
MARTRQTRSPSPADDRGDVSEDEQPEVQKQTKSKSSGDSGRTHSTRKSARKAKKTSKVTAADNEALAKELKKQMASIAKQKKELAKLIKSHARDAKESGSEDSSDGSGAESEDSVDQDAPRFSSLGETVRPTRVRKRKVARLGSPIPAADETSPEPNHAMTNDDVDVNPSRGATPALTCHSSTSRAQRTAPLILPSSRQSSITPPTSRSPSQSASGTSSRHASMPASNIPPQTLIRDNSHASASPVPEFSNTRLRPRSTSTEGEDSAQKRQRRSHSPAQRQCDPIPYKDGKAPQGQRPKQGDYEKWFRKLILAAIGLYDIKLATVHAFPSANQQTIWARDAWSSVCADHQKCYADDDCRRVMTLIVSQGSTFRGHLKDRLRTRVLDTFKIVETPDGPDASGNSVLYRRLLEGSPPRYCHKIWDTESPASYGEHDMFALALREQFFRDAQDVGAVHQDKFNPIPLPTLALLFTVIRYHLDCYKDGQLDTSATFSEVDYRGHYAEHLQWVNHWSSLDPDETREVRTEIFRTVLRVSKVTPTCTTITRFSQDAEDRVRAELLARRRAREQAQSRAESDQSGDVGAAEAQG